MTYAESLYSWLETFSEYSPSATSNCHNDNLVTTSDGGHKNYLWC